MAKELLTNRNLYKFGTLSNSKTEGSEQTPEKKEDDKVQGTAPVESPKINNSHSSINPITEGANVSNSVSAKSNKEAAQVGNQLSKNTNKQEEDKNIASVSTKFYEFFNRGDWIGALKTIYGLTQGKLREDTAAMIAQMESEVKDRLAKSRDNDGYGSISVVKEERAIRNGEIPS